MTAQDEDEFLEFIRSTGDVIIVPSTSKMADGEAFSSFDELNEWRLGSGCHLWNRSISPKPIFQYFDAHGGCYCLDFLNSEVVNIMRSKIDSDTISMGRFHIEDRYIMQNGTESMKSTTFLIWFKKICNWIKKGYPTVFDGAHMSFRVKHMQENGIELIGHKLN